ncbi:bifunctional [glutamate--ammonia ligase]-adenylyl-L-tyrosine phosphorylase/[glutamate--ammonia-ligase] adenylyltransferase [Limnohabitans sp. Bal53]|uniref:bifunctional [glutamate--ammonia ligase]-adenylyl-L-tyrosine phosphorylase/[glutamate--ammonia-ligase] adenylyltransferase n=1 Tax=Limnohabitans sp. Bal53 TaxID=1977910 RepID=UPI000DD2799F|nr:bifunctional [glutamate--ammonia ligase]-adenylyl-L-tyrosine phosphorylase/[glutamate--ammonia-ligase] adenylyltransferase [Limnohabitans sp. Bal53]PUE39391.1 bifunctional glutamine synthetase adenylyltransferase/deadenyltransferase [Limnohabitans sp. Bal53]
MTRSQSKDDRSDLVSPIVLAPGAPDTLDLPHGLPSYSRFVQRLHRRYADELPLLPPGPPTRDSLNAAYAALQAKELDTSAALRVLRQLTLERLAQLDCSRQADLVVVTHGMTWLAEVTLDIAWQQVVADLDGLHGAPTKASGERAEMWIIGMGKLGARELNVSSDIDLIYVYDEDGQTLGNSEGRNKVSCQEYFTRAVKRMYALIGDTTEHGFVFRVDLALRPNGNSGPSVVSLDALEEYLLVQGREWERFAWMKSRVVAPRSAVVNGSAQALRAVVLPFVFRRYLDYNVFESLRTLHQQIRDHAAKRSAGHPERANDVKLSRGGIREIEFTVQLLQVVRGGQFPELRTRSTLDALQRVAKAGLMPQATADALGAAYVFLRQVEHRIQYLDDQQTHVLPTRDDDLAWMAQTLGHANACAFLSELDAHREVVAQEFDTLLGGDRECKTCNGKNGKTNREHADLDAVLSDFSGSVRERLAQWADNPRVQSLRDDARGRLMRLLQRTAQWLDAGRVSEVAVLRMVDWIEPLLRRESYLALMLERPSVHERLLRLLGAAKWPARYLLQHPGVIDELAGGNLFDSRFDAAEFEGELQARLVALQRTGEDDEESLMNLLRRAHHAEQFRTLARDVEGVLTVEQVADDLSALADAVLRVTARWCWDRLKNRHREEPAIAIVGYGKLGGKELGYGSDLDIVFVYEDEDERAQEIYAAYVRKLINWMTVKTAEGDLYEIDTALRPNGNSGLLVTRFEAYADYQQQRGSNTAWTWEHQAMTRARFVMGWPSLAPRFDAVRHAVICAPRDAASLKAEIVAMRERVRQGHPVKADHFDVKHSPGGMVDAEFAVQYLVLLHTAAHPELADNVGNIALLIRAEVVGLLPMGMGQAAANAYREMRKVQHRARLNEEPTDVPLATLAPERDAVLALWRFVMV